jgi:Zn-dependent protease with chaperone function
MLNSLAQFILLAIICAVPFYFQYWLKTTPEADTRAVNSLASKLCIFNLSMLFASSLLATHDKTDKQSLVMFGAVFFSSMLLFSFRNKAAQNTQKHEVKPKEQLIQSARAFAAIGGTFFTYSFIIYHLASVIGMLPAVAIAITTLIAIAPLMVRVLFSCNRMHDSPLKDELVAIFRKAGVSIGEIYLIDSNKTRVSNALVCGSRFGFGPLKRSLFLTENLFEILNEEELRAVISHEASHFQLHHVAKRGLSALIVIIAALICVGLPIGLVAVSIESKDWINTLAIINLVANLIFQYFFIFRVIRKHEFEADLNAIRLGAGT